MAGPGGSIDSTYLGNSYRVFSGTSMASPHVAGIFALAIAAGVKDPRGFIHLSTNQTTRDNKLGWGVLDAVKIVSHGDGTPPPPKPPEDLPPTDPGKPINVIGGNLSFDASDSFDPDGEVVLYDYWLSDFDRWLGPVTAPTSGAEFSSSGKPRNVHVGCRVTDNQGATGVTWKYFRIYSELENPPPPKDNIPPVAIFTWKNNVSQDVGTQNRLVGKHGTTVTWPN